MLVIASASSIGLCVELAHNLRLCGQGEGALSFLHSTRNLFANNPKGSRRLIERYVPGLKPSSRAHILPSMTNFRLFTTTQEPVLALWSPLAQLCRPFPEAHMANLLIPLSSNIRLDSLRSTLSMFLELLQIEEAEEQDWMTATAVNIDSAPGKEQQGNELEEEDIRRIYHRWGNLMGVDEVLAEDVLKESDVDGENDSEEVKALKVRLFQ
jgi:hypothetical protein